MLRTVLTPFFTRYSLNNAIRYAFIAMQPTWPRPLTTTVNNEKNMEKLTLLADQPTIQSQCPELIKFWHPSKNDNLHPENILINSGDKIWWKCTKGPDHEWQATPRSMYKKISKSTSVCPFCRNRMVSVTNSLATLYPEIAAQWHPTLNGDLLPSSVRPTSAHSVWWKCEKGKDHVWKRVISHRVHPRSAVEGLCPFCAKVDANSKSLAVCRPDLAKEWDRKRNGNLTPETVSKSSSKSVWWICPKGHHYQATVYNRGSTHNAGCPVCSARKTTDETRLSSHPGLLQFFDFERNRSRTYLCCLIRRYQY